MKRSKKTRTSSIGQSKDKANNWKRKAIFRRKENEKLRKRIKELVQSREGWKKKHKEEKKKVERSSPLQGEKAAKHQYSMSLIVLIIELYKYGGMSLRSCRHSLCCMFLCLGLNHRVPSHSSIRNWICKCGIYRVKKESSNLGDYVIFVDESITFGSEKMLLILGVPLNKVSPSSALSHSDMFVLYIGVSQEWKAEQIQEQIENTAHNKTIKYVVSDQGTNLCKAYKLLNYTHIEDSTHILANYLKHLYNKDADFETFRKLIGKLRRDWNLSKTNSRYMPPGMRGKMRFANIFPCVNWAKKTLLNWDNLSEDVQEKLAFLKDKPDFIQSLIEVEIIFKTTCAKLKNEGFGTRQKQEILDAFSKIKAGDKASIFIQNCKDYLDSLEVKRDLLQQEHLLCSSDIIESYFGKFKAKIKPNNRSGLTEFIYILPTFGQPFSEQEAKQALQNVKCKDLKLYRNKEKAA